MSEQRGCLWEARFRSYEGTLAWASHWMVELRGYSEDVTVNLRLGAVEAKAYSTEDFTWKVGDWSNKFPTQRDALEAAKVAFAHLAGPDDVLVDEYMEVLAANDTERAQAIEQAQLDDDFHAEVHTSFIPHLQDTSFGYNAPPSVRHKMEVEVERDGETFRICDSRK